MNFYQSLILEEENLLNKINLPVDPEYDGNRTMIGPTRWFFVPQDESKSMVSPREVRLMKYWRYADNLRYRYVQGELFG